MDSNIVNLFNSELIEIVRYNNKYMCPKVNRHDEEEVSLTFLQMNILFNLFKGGECVEATTGKLASMDNTSKTFMSSNIAKLTRMKLVERFQKDDNYRYIYVKLTQKGIEFCKKRSFVRSEYIGKVLDSIASEEEVLTMTKHFQEINLILSRLNTLPDDFQQ